jgi:hypothetical protein
MIRYLDGKDKEEIRPLARTVAHGFLTSELEDVEAKIRKRTAYLERWYPDKAAIPAGEADLLAIYQQQVDIIDELMDQSGEEILVDVLRRRRQTAEERLLATADWDPANVASRSAHWQIKTEVEILRDLQGKWLDWLKA